MILYDIMVYGTVYIVVSCGVCGITWNGKVSVCERMSHSQQSTKAIGTIKVVLIP
jgi:hypothetical protein